MTHSVHHVTSMYVFRTGYLAMDNHLVLSSQGKLFLPLSASPSGLLFFA